MVEREHDRVDFLVAESLVRHPRDDTTDVNKLRILARRVALQLGYDRSFAQAVVENVTALHYVTNGIGPPDSHLQRAVNFARKKGLSDEERAVTSGLARQIFDFLPTGADSLTNRRGIDEIVVAMGRERLARTERGKRERINREGERLKTRWQRLMAYSDEEIAIINSNFRVNFQGDRVYQSAQNEIRAKMIRRQLTRTEYRESLHRQRLEQATFRLNTRPDEREKLLERSVGILRDHKIAVLPEDRQQAILQFIQKLLAGEPVVRGRIIRQGFNPYDLLKRARRILISYHMERSEKMRDNRILPVDMPVSTKRGTDPHRFLADGSGRSDE